MDLREISFQYHAYTAAKELFKADQELIEEAIKACGSAYAPYSNFKVGAAIRTDDNLIIPGSNQENSAFPIGQCAERVALYSLAHLYGRKVIDTVAVAVDSDYQESPTSPCGSCRQLLSEYRSYQTSPIRLLLTLAKGGVVYEIHDVNDLLPLAFDGKFLGE